MRLHARVRAHIPEDTDEHPEWVEDMDQFDNRIGTVISEYADGTVRVNFDPDTRNYLYNTKWLTLECPDGDALDRLH
jgi:hypothetical protein